MSYFFEWKARQAHEYDVNMILVRLGFRDEQGRIRRFIGSQFLPEALKSGHSTFGFDMCKCRLPEGKHEDDKSVL